MSENQANCVILWWQYMDKKKNIRSKPIQNVMKTHTPSLTPSRVSVIANQSETWGDCDEYFMSFSAWNSSNFFFTIAWNSSSGILWISSISSAVKLSNKRRANVFRTDNVFHGLYILNFMYNSFYHQYDFFQHTWVWASCYNEFCLFLIRNVQNFLVLVIS